MEAIIKRLEEVLDKQISDGLVSFEDAFRDILESL